MDSSSWCYELGRYVKLSYEIIYVLVYICSLDALVRCAAHRFPDPWFDSLFQRFIDSAVDHGYIGSSVE